jgi:hypothetical protein
MLSFVLTFGGPGEGLSSGGCVVNPQTPLSKGSQLVVDMFHPLAALC